MLRPDLFTVVHEQFMTDTARLADIVLPATTQLEQTDLHKPYGHRHLQYNHAAIEPLAEAKSNWEVSQLLARAMGYDEPWLHQSPEEVLAEIIEASREANSTLNGITLERLQDEGTVHLAWKTIMCPSRTASSPRPPARWNFAARRWSSLGLDPLPAYVTPAEFTEGLGLDDAGQPALVLITGASHHFVSTSMANQPSLVAQGRARRSSRSIRTTQLRAASSTARTSWSPTARLVHAARRRDRRCHPGRRRSPPRAAGLRSRPMAATSTG